MKKKTQRNHSKLYDLISRRNEPRNAHGNGNGKSTYSPVQEKSAHTRSRSRYTWTVDMFSTTELCQNHVHGAEKNTHPYSSLLVSTMEPQAPHRAREGLHISWWTRNKNEKCLKHITSSTLVKCISMIVSVVMPSYPAITFFLWYVMSEHWTTAHTLNTKINHNIP